MKHDHWNKNKVKYVKNGNGRQGNKICILNEKIDVQDVCLHRTQESEVDKVINPKPHDRKFKSWSCHSYSWPGVQENKIGHALKVEKKAFSLLPVNHSDAIQSWVTGSLCALYKQKFMDT